MESRCYACQVGRHIECVEVGCICLVCIADVKEQDPIPTLEIHID